MSLTNTDPRKTDLFAKFDWPRVSCPHIDFSLPESERETDVIEREQQAEREIRQFIEQRGIDICALIIEPIQGEGAITISGAGGCKHYERFATKTMSS